MDAIVSATRIARVMGLKGKIASLADLDGIVRAGLPKTSLAACIDHVYVAGPDRQTFLYRVVPEATYKRRGESLKPDESERTERLARVIATAEYVWDDEADARIFLTTPHPELGGERPIEIALTELGARRIERLLWTLFHGLPA